MSKNYRPIRTALFVPGDRPDRVDKAVNAGADMVIVDLEDAVADSRKEEIRSGVREKVSQYRDKVMMVRVNALDTGFFTDDLKAVVVEGLTAVMVPMVESAEQIRRINDQLLKTEKENGLAMGAVAVMPLVETAKAIQNIYQIVSEKTDPDRLWTVAFGAADYTLTMGIEMTVDAAELNYPRSRITVACRAAEVEPPIESPYMIDIKDISGLAADTKRSKQLGFQGRLCVHPSQVGPCNDIYSPSSEEIAQAGRIIEAFKEAQAKGLAAIQLDGKFIDPPVVERSKMILQLAERIVDGK